MSDQTRLLDLLARWEELNEAGTPATPEDLCADHPDLLPAVRRALAGLVRVDHLLGAGGSTPSAAAGESTATPPVPGAGDRPPARGPLPTVHGYEIESELGRGGMGVVYMARQLQPPRPVALKMILAGSHAGPGQRARFTREAEALARLRHPNIVQVYEAGEADGHPFFSLEFCDGGTLAGRLAAGPVAPPAAADLVRTLARAVQAAHDAGIVHRDLKPANVLLLADGTPKVTDFGLAKQAGADLTASGAVMGTPAYMAPEQAEGRGAGPAADVWALGAVLYECLAGRPPFQGATPLDTMRQVAADDPAPVRQLRRDVPADLETVCLKCLQKDPARRYASAAALADDLGRVREGRPILARPAGRAERAAKWVRRNPTLAGAAAAVFLALAAGAGVSLRYGIEARDQAAAARDRGQAAERAADRERATAARATAGEVAARRSLRQMAVADGLRLAESGDTAAALVRFAAALPADPADPAAVPFAAERFAAHERYGVPFRRLAEVREAEFVQAARLTPDGRTLLTACDAGVHVWDLAAPDRPRAAWAAPGSDPVFSGDGRRVAFMVTSRPPKGPGQLSPPDGVRVLDAVTGKPVGPDVPLPAQAGSVSLSAEGDRIAFARHTPPEAEVWDVRATRRLLKVALPVGAGRGIASAVLHPDGSKLVGWGGAGASVWDVGSGLPAGPRLAPDREVRGGLFPATGRTVCLSFEKEVVCYDWSDSKLVWSVPHRWATELDVSPDGQELLIAHGHEDQVGVAVLFDARTGSQIAPPFAHSDRAYSVTGADNNTTFNFRLRRGIWGNPSTSFSADGRRVVTVGQSSVRVWERVPPPVAGPLPPPYVRPGREAGMSPDFRRMLNIHRTDRSKDGPVCEFDRADLTVSALRERRLPKGDVEYAVAGYALSAVFSPDGRQLMITSAARPYDRGGTVRVWDRATGRPAYPPLAHPGTAFAAYGPSGRRVVTAGPAGWRVWDAATGAAVGPGGGWAGGPLQFAAVRPDDEAVLLLDDGFAARLYAIESGQPLGPEFRLPWAGYAVFSPDGRRLAAPAGGGTGRVVDPATGEPAGPTIPALFPGGVGDTVLSPDGALVLTLKMHQFRVFEVATGQPVTPVLTAAGPFFVGAGFSPDGRRVGAVKVRVTPDDRIELVGCEWDLTFDGTPAAAVRAARVASGREPDAFGGLVLVPADRQQADWAEERAASGAPVWSPAQVRDWHLERVAAAEFVSPPDWRAAAFHLGILAARAPDDLALRSRLGRAVRERDARPPEGPTPGQPKPAPK